MKCKIENRSCENDPAPVCLEDSDRVTFQEDIAFKNSSELSRYSRI